MSEVKSLYKKKILFFSPAFFSYEIKIKEAMEKAGATVCLYDERSVTSALSRAILKVTPGVFNRISSNYYHDIIEKNKNVNFDFILIVRCDMVSVKILKLLRLSFPNAKICLHLWDSKKNIKNIDSKIDMFDYVSSFDLNDCNEDSRLHFRPLFYIDDFRSQTKIINKYDLCFCGTIHSDRYYVINRVFTQAKEKGLNTIAFSYLPGKFIFYFYKLFAKGFKKAKKSEFSYNKKTIEEIMLIEKSSNVILDIHHPNQTGLTMRTIEMVGAKKKFITTNESIVNYDFFNKNNIFVIDRNNPVLDMSFFETEYIEISNDIYNKYCLNQWILDVLGENV